MQKTPVTADSSVSNFFYGGVATLKCLLWYGRWIEIDSWLSRPNLVQQRFTKLGPLCSPSAQLSESSRWSRDFLRLSIKPECVALLIISQKPIEHEPLLLLSIPLNYTWSISSMRIHNMSANRFLEVWRSGARRPNATEAESMNTKSVCGESGLCAPRNITALMEDE